MLELTSCNAFLELKTAHKLSLVICHCEFTKAFLFIVPTLTLLQKIMFLILYVQMQFLHFNYRIR